MKTNAPSLTALVSAALLLPLLACDPGEGSADSATTTGAPATSTSGSTSDDDGSVPDDDDGSTPDDDGADQSTTSAGDDDTTGSSGDDGSTGAADESGDTGALTCLERGTGVRACDLYLEETLACIADAPKDVQDSALEETEIVCQTWVEEAATEAGAAAVAELCLEALEMTIPICLAGGSCEGSCDSKDPVPAGPEHDCYCDPGCLEFKDCCPDYADICQ